MINLNNDFIGILTDLKSTEYQYPQILQALRDEEGGQNRKPVIIALRRALDGSDNLDSNSIYRAIKASETRRRRRIVNKAYMTNPIWMWDIIRKHYPDYTEDMLPRDLYQPKRIRKCITAGELESFRGSQIRKLYDAINNGHETLSQNAIANLIANHINNYGKRLYFTVKKGNESQTYSFRPKETETNIKKFLTRIPSCNSIQEVDTLFDGIINPRYGH